MNAASKTCKWYPVCPMKYYFDREELDEKWVREYCHGNWAACTRYRMEERGDPHPDNMLPDGTIDKHLT